MSRIHTPGSVGAEHRFAKSGVRVDEARFKQWDSVACVTRSGYYPTNALGYSLDWINMITITESAQEYLAELLAKQEDALGVRVFINDPGTPRAETCIAYCREGDIEEGDVEQAFDSFTAWFQGRSIPFLEDALVDYSSDRMGGQLTIKAPNAKMPRVSDDSPIEDRINYLLYNEINPSLAAHGGEVSLIEVTEDQFAVLRFGGGCQGCSAVDMTLKGGVEKTLLEQIPQLAGVRDNTDHSDRSQAYY